MILVFFKGVYNTFAYVQDSCILFGFQAQGAECSACVFTR
ncbi:hypothetical protein QSI_4362 [Clostridioides difficile P28]|nr:hypothetical protein QSI_4362 [Clostridioides difficile P28]